MDPQGFLEALLSPVGSGIFLWGLVAMLIKAWPKLDSSSELKFWITWLLSFIIPPAAYGTQIALGYEVFTIGGLFTAIGTAYLLSQGIHRGTEKAEKIAKGQP